MINFFVFINVSKIFFCIVRTVVVEGKLFFNFVTINQFQPREQFSLTSQKHLFFSQYYLLTTQRGEIRVR